MLATPDIRSKNEGHWRLYPLLLSNVISISSRWQESFSCTVSFLILERISEVASTLARLWITQKRGDDARRRLGDVYSWFTEGFETPDLQAAQLLLARL